MSAYTPNTLLIVEDYDVIRSILSKLCLENHYTIISTGNVKEALIALKKDHPKIIIFDVNMKTVKDPIGAITSLRSSHPSSTIIAVDGINAFKEQQLLLQGTDKVLHRPPVYSEYATELNTALARLISSGSTN